MTERIKGYDLIRTFSIIVVFFAHIILGQSKNPYSTIIFKSLSPGITMSLLAFISACLLVNNKSLENDFSSFLLKRLIRIYVPVILVLTFAVLFNKYQGINIQKDHLIYNYLGLGLFFDWFKVSNKSSVGWGLWFITAILIMYVLLPVLKRIFNHKNGLIHYGVIYLLCILINYITVPSSSSFWNVAISFSLGVYLFTNNLLDRLINMKFKIAFPLSLILLMICALSFSGFLYYDIPKYLYPMYPIAFTPLFFRLANHLPELVERGVKRFSEISFEFYMVHFYFINGAFSRLFGNRSLLFQIVIGSLISLFLAFIIAKIGNKVRKLIETYFLNT